jgi:tetratricopeptide (TPR) repeat protein
MFGAFVLLLALGFTPIQDRETVRQSEQHFARGVELQQGGDLAGAREAYEAALKLIPRRVDALSNLGVIHSRLGQYEQAINNYKAALAIDPKEHDIRLNLGIAYFQIDKYELARVELEQVVKAHPHNVQARFLHGMCLFEIGKLKEAIAELEPIYQSQPDNLSFAYALANAYIQDEQIEKGQILVDKVFRNLNSAEAHLILGTVSLARKQLQPAVDELKLAVELNPKLPTAHSQLGVVYLLTGNRDLAIQEFRKELEVNPKDFTANTRLGWLMREEGKFAEAEALLRRGLELRPEDPGPLFQLAQLAQAEGKYEEAVSLLERITKILPDYNPAHVLLARLYFKLKRVDDARREQAIIERLTAEQQKKQPTADKNPLLRDPYDRVIQKPQ